MNNPPSIQWPTGLEAFRQQITFHFVAALGVAMKSRSISQKELAERLGVSEGRVSQVLNNPGNLTLKSMVEWAHAVGIKPSVILYDDHDPDYQLPAVYADAFVQAWNILGRPRSFDDVESVKATCRNCEQLTRYEWTQLQRSSAPAMVMVPVAGQRRLWALPDPKDAPGLAA